MALAIFLALQASGLWLRYPKLQNLIPSYPWIAPGWRAWGIKFCYLATFSEMRVLLREGMAAWKVLPLLAFFLLAAALSADAQKFKMEELDFTEAEADPATGQLCITRKYCLANAEELAKRLPQEPCFPPGCNCNADGDCTNGTAPYCADCRCSSFPQGRTRCIRTCDFHVIFLVG